MLIECWNRKHATVDGVDFSKSTLSSVLNGITVVDDTGILVSRIMQLDTVTMKAVVGTPVFYNGLEKFVVEEERDLSNCQILSYINPGPRPQDHGECVVLNGDLEVVGPYKDHHRRKAIVGNV